MCQPILTISILKKWFHLILLTVSLVWGCELKGVGKNCCVWIRGSASYEAVNWKILFWLLMFLKLWSASYEAVNWKIQCGMNVIQHPRSASYEAVNWKNMAFSLLHILHRSASYEAVNWKELVPVKGHNSRWSASYEAVNWKIEGRFGFGGAGLASYEAVNWKTTATAPIVARTGQPRMRLWIER